MVRLSHHKLTRTSLSFPARLGVLLITSRCIGASTRTCPCSAAEAPHRLVPSHNALMHACHPRLSNHGPETLFFTTTGLLTRPIFFLPSHCRMRPDPALAPAEKSFSLISHWKAWQCQVMSTGAMVGYMSDCYGTQQKPCIASCAARVLSAILHICSSLDID
ncbi:hypothetical protein DER46DRAFT_193811 [Fusarium sp. MPI-SDFR-AT-0072]|nr:hypothetical protein DER46DRAFT_193811 [Fusarium sp. MPI-SDFR-AT-0072]